MTRAQLIAPTPTERWPRPPAPAPFDFKFWRPPRVRKDPPKPWPKVVHPPLDRDSVPELPPEASSEAVLAGIVKALGIDIPALQSRYRLPNLVRARQMAVAILIAYRRPLMSWPSVSKLVLGRNSHSTALSMTHRWAADAVLVGETIALARQLGLQIGPALEDLEMRYCYKLARQGGEWVTTPMAGR